jgi:ABC-2 type transport system ATP-binding protein
VSIAAVPAAFEATGLTKSYRGVDALQDCTLRVPQGHVTALVGANGAGKTTLLKLLVGLASPSAGEVSVFGAAPDGTERFLSSVGYLAQDVPMYGRLTAAEHIDIGAHINLRWDAEGARHRLAAAEVPLDRPVQTLSGGQRAQVGLSLALAKEPELLLLDEPMAALDPLARRAFLSTLSGAVADGGLSVVLSSHLLHDLERVCDHIVLLSSARVMLCEEIESLLDSHRMLVGPRRPGRDWASGMEVVHATNTRRQTRALVRLHRPVADPSWEESEVDLEDVVLGYMGGDAAAETDELVVTGFAS